MQYLLLIYDNEAEMLANRTGSGEVMMKEYREFTDSILKSGNMKAGDALQPTSTATCVRIRNGKTLTTDGPFAETKEQLGGYYLIEAKDLDEATKIAARDSVREERHDRGAAGPGVRGLSRSSCRRSGYPRAPCRMPVATRSRASSSRSGVGSSRR